MKSLIQALFLVGLPFLAACGSAPQYPKPVPRPAGDPGISLTGRWYSDFGYMDLVQSGWTFEGTYSCCQGTIRGEIKGQQIEFFWNDSIYGEGWGYFQVSEEGRMLMGTWGTSDDMGSSGYWNARRLEGRTFEGEPSRWRVAAVHPQFGEIEGEAVLYFEGDRVTGKLDAVGRTTTLDKPYRVDVLRFLAGRVEGDKVVLEWTEPRYGTVGEIRLTREGDVMRGMWDVYRIDAGVEDVITFRRIPND